MKSLNVHINEAWSGTKQHALKSDIKAWCDEMGIKKYTINSKSEIDVDGDVNLPYNDFEELPYKFGTVTGYFDIDRCKNLISLKNCPDKVEGYFTCEYCSKLDSLEGCPQKVEGNFYCGNCKRKFTRKQVKMWCEIKGEISI